MQISCWPHNYEYMKSNGTAQPTSHPIAIIGAAFRFPGDLCDATEFWKALEEGRDLVTEIPQERWATDELRHSRRSEPGRSISFSAGVLSRIDEFDADFFGISPREAAWLDPQQRLLLELSWEAMENAGVVPSAIAGSDCAVYVGISSLDYGVRGIDDMASMGPHSMTGNTLSIAANRLSYVFDLRGPSLAVDTACSSSLVALHHACNSLRAGESSMALVGGVNLLLHPYPFVGFTKASMLSADGRCRPFDETGSGYVRSEGSAVLLLKPLENALRDGDEVQAVILASGVNADGARKTGITIPSSDGQAELMQEVLSRSGLGPGDVDFIEAHGTGTAVGDPIEAAAIGRVYGQARTQPLPIGSVKANLGHLESASGMAGLVKVMLALRNRALPPALHLRRPNPRIDFGALNLQTVTEYMPLTKAGGKPLVAGINSFGFGGANAHVLLQEFQTHAEGVDCGSGVAAIPPLLLSARSDDALRAMAQRYADLLRGKSEEDLRDIVHAAALGRERLEKRLALYPDSAASAAERLQRYAQGELPHGLHVEEELPQGGGLAFVYSGNGAQWLGMGRALLAESPQFAALLAELDGSMRPHAGFSVIQQLQADESEGRLDDTSVAQPLLFAMQVAITCLLKEAGLRPRATTGHSVGEIAAAWAAGALSLPQAIQVICARSKAQAQTRGTGRMAALGMPQEAAREIIERLQVDVEIAGINSHSSVTLSGGLDGLLRIQQAVESEGVFFRQLDLDYAFHSRQMDPIEDQLAQWLQGLEPVRAAQATFISTVTGDVLAGEALDADYWWRNVREPVLFAQAVDRAAALGCRVFIEIGPHAILQRYISETLALAGIKGRVLPTLRRNDDGPQRLQETALRAHLLAGTDQLTDLFTAPARHVQLPSYPWQRQRCWHPRTSEGASSFERRRVHPLLGWRLQGAQAAWENTLDAQVLPWLADHQVGAAIVYPGAAYAEMALAAAREWLRSPRCVVEQLDIVAPMVFDGEHGRTLWFSLDPRDGSFQIKSRQRLSSDEWTLHAAGRVREAAGRMPVPRIAKPAKPVRQLGHATHYRLAAELGLNYGPAFQGLEQVCVGNDRLEADVALPASLGQADYLLHPALLDVCFQTLVDFFAERIEAGQGIALLPVKMGYVEICAPGPATRLRSHLIRSSNRSVLADFELLDDADQLVATIRGGRFRAAHLKRQAPESIAQWRIVPWLKPHSSDGTSTALPATADLVAHADAALAALADQRQTWFRQTLPLMEALVLSFAHEACSQLGRERGQDWSQLLETPMGRWLAGLMRKESLLVESAEAGVVLADDPDLPDAQSLWQAIVQENPSCLPQLSLLGRVGRQLTGLLSGQVDAHTLAQELRQSPMIDVLHQADPAYMGMRTVLQAMLDRIASNWPAERRLRVLELSAGPSELPHALIGSLPPDHFDYVLAVADEGMQARQGAEYQEHAGIAVTGFDPSDLCHVPPEHSPKLFDVIVVRHSLHRVVDPRGVLARLHGQLAAGGMVLVAERHADWSADFIEGVDPKWWHSGNGAGAEPLSSLMSPRTWLQLLQDAGFADSSIFAEPDAQQLAAGAYVLMCRKPVLAESASPPLPGSAFWLLLADDTSWSCAQQLAAHLESQGQQAAVTARFDSSELVEAGHVVHLQGWSDGPGDAAGTASRLLSVVQALGSLQSVQAPRLWLVTKGGALASNLPDEIEPRPAQAALWGFGRVVMNECPQLACTLIELACGSVGETWLAKLGKELLHSDGTSEVLLCTRARYSLTMQEATSVPAVPRQRSDGPSRMRLDFLVPGQLRNLVWLAQSERALRDDEVEVRTQAAGLNFRDVMYLMGLLPDEAVENGFAGASLGLEFSGVISRVGAQVRDLRPGDAVMGFGASCFASHVVTPAHALALMPRRWSFEAAATVPTVFFTVYYAFKQLADLQPGERVLVHGAAGGVGIAAIQLARHLGAQVYATAGSDEKRDFVKLLGADHVFDSRSLAFADDVLSATDGEGVDVVLNSLAGEAMRRSLDVLKPFGRFLELGKRDFFENTPVGLRPLRNNISYFGIDADQLLTGRPALAARLFSEVMELFHEQVLTPLPYRSFSADRVVDAFRAMQQARHIGKLVVSLQELPPAALTPASVPQTDRCLPTGGCWLVTGGLSGFGLESARWLAAQGVSHLVLVGRRGAQTPGARQAMDALAAQGINVVAEACDIADAVQVQALMHSLKGRLPPLTGILHAAAVFDDRLLVHLDEQSMGAVLSAKLVGACNLHRATEGMALEHFVLYSSITTAIGNPGQANYVAANAGLEALALLRRRLGLPATCLAWGPIGDAGYLERNQGVRDSLAQRLGKPPINAGQALAQLGRTLLEDSTLSLPANFDWNVLARPLASSGGSRFELLNRLREEQSGTTDVLDIRAQLADKTPEEATAIVSELVTHEVAQVLCVAAGGIKPQASLHDLGMDSLMAVELALGLEQRFGIQLPVMMLNDAPSVSNVTSRIVEKLMGDGQPVAQESQVALVAATVQQHGEGMTADQLQGLVEDARKLAQQGAKLIS